jgi:predicted transcriptional regulator of viral defense system
MKKRLGKLESMALAYTQMRGMQVVRTGQLAEPLGLSRKQEMDIFERLLRGKLVARLRRGAYLFPSTLPVAGEWAPDETMALNALMKDAGARYQLCGPNAFNRYGLSEQVPNRLYVYNDKLSGERTVGAVGITLVRVAGKRLGDTEVAKRPGGNALVFSSRVRTLVDAIYDWSRFDSLPRGFAWMRTEIGARRVKPAALVRCALRYGDVGTVRRIGCILERLGLTASQLAPLRRALRPTRASIALVPTRPKRGRVNTRWGVVENDRPGDIDEPAAS